MKSQSGFTLVELMVTLTVAAILLAMSAPSMRDLIQNNRATAYANEMVLAFTIARAEALKRNGPVTVCAAAPVDPATGAPTGCAADGDWSQGWLVFQDAAVAGAPNPTGAGAQLIRVWPAARDFKTFTGADEDDRSEVPSAFRFNRQGGATLFPEDTSRTFRVQAHKCRGEQGRELTVAPMGRVVITRQGCV
jgi:type IV fimbrial biogenesis protein FimT